MPDQGPGAGVERASDFSTSVARWDAELRAAEKVYEKWRKDAKRISDRYTLEKRRKSTVAGQDELIGDFNILHSNVQTMQPAIFGKEPVPVVSRRHADRDPIGRIAAEVLERAVKTEMEGDGFDVTMGMVTQDLLLVGRGVAWVRYMPDIRELPDGEEVVAGARTPMDYVNWGNFLHSPKETWAEVASDGWVARAVSMTRDQGLQRFGEVFKEVPLGETGPGMEDKELSEDMREVIGRARVWEVWDMATRRAIWICREYQDRVLDEQDDPLSLKGFFPCAMPAFGTKSNMRLVPTPDYLQYEKLADELDEQTAKISILTSALRVRGVYPQAMEGIGRLLEEDDEGNKLIGITNWAAFEGRQLEEIVKFLPLKQIAEALVALYDARARTKETLYEVSGLSDIMRGQVDPREKLGQSRLKGQFASQRLQAKIQTIERCARDTIAIKAEIMAEHYPPDLLRELSGFDFLPEVEELPPHLSEMLFEQAIQLLRNDKLRGFRIDVETNSTILVDDEEEKQKRIEFLESFGTFIERSLPLAMQVPETAPMLLDMLKFVARSFRAGRQLEASIEQMVEQIKQKLDAPPEEPQPDPAAEAEAAKAQQQMELEQQKGQIEIQSAQAKAQSEMQVTQANAQATMMAAQAKVQQLREKTAADQEKAQIDAQMAEAEIELKIAEMDIEREKLAMDLEAQRQQALIAIATPQPGGTETK